MSELKNKTIITVATTGAWPTKANNPNVPMTPEEIAEDVYACWKAGAAIAHLHMRDDEGHGTMDKEKFRKTVELLRANHPDCDIILNMTTSGDIHADDTTRQIHLKELRPEMGSYDCGSMNWLHTSLFLNPPAFLEELGKNMQEALFKGLVSAGYKVEKETRGGVLISVNRRDQPEIVGIARKLDDMGYKLYATDGTAHEISQLGTDVEVVGKLGQDNRVFEMLEQGKIDYVILTGSTEPQYIRDFIHLNHRCVQLGIPCLTSLDTANALTDILASRYNQQNTELIDICHLRTERQKLHFAKMQTCGNDYIFLESFHGEITCPESLCVTLCDRHYGIGADGIILMEHSAKADAKMRMFNADGSEGAMAGNALRCMAKYLYDNDIVKKEVLAIETGTGVKQVQVYTTNGKVTSACVDMGYATLDTAALRFAIPEKTVVDYPVRIGGRPYNITCVDMGNPHCVVFCPRVDAVDMDFIGPRFEHAPYFPERINTEFIRVVNPNTIKMRVWERGSGETLACGTGACAAVVAAVANGLCSKGSDVTVRVRGGDLVVNYTDERVTLTGDAKLVFTGEVEY